MTLGLINANPVVHAKKERVARTEEPHDDDALDPLEIYDILFLFLLHFLFTFGVLFEFLLLKIKNHTFILLDPEHPYSLEQLSVLSEESITVDEKLGRILITFTPTIQHCSMATVIGLCLREKLKDCFHPHFKFIRAVFYLETFEENNLGDKVQLLFGTELISIIDINAMSKSFRISLVGAV
ncbi:unnamed protein product [Fraxinus pennsylvanica]|uniref:MIP18 family-like domain-containing protein n=1 Tax=Fraxinus pennsylvanica TaxID=56036 RepID=A0AAD1Z726_9LAMI|nr:unnamed protein product [Fraxinus pennsylvanica]